MSEQQLDCAQIAGLAIDLHRLGSAKRMCAIGAAIQPSALDPASHNARVLARREVRLFVDSARKDARASICGARRQPALQRGAGLVRDLELNRTTSLVLDNCRPLSDMPAYGDVIELEG
jgi:hypothetical protein